MNYPRMERPKAGDPIDNVVIVREQFTARDYEYHPEIAHDNEYMDFERRSTEFSDSIITYGYRKYTHIGNGNCKIEWVKRSEAFKQLP